MIRATKTIPSNGEGGRRCETVEEESVLMQRLPYVPETVLCNKIAQDITQIIRELIVRSFKDSPPKPLGR